MLFVIYFVCYIVSSYADLTQYDQRQTGDVNVQVDVKDVQFFAILKGDKEEYVDYDYAYDYSELTIKPQNRTTPKPHNGLSASNEQNIVTRDNSTLPTTVSQDHTITPLNNELTTLLTAATATAATKDKDDSTTTIRNYPDVTSEHNISTVKGSTVTAVHSGSTRKNCKKGYVLNQKGQCQLRMNTTENALLRLVKLSQKLKLRRENKGNKNT